MPHLTTMLVQICHWQQSLASNRACSPRVFFSSELFPIGQQHACKFPFKVYWEIDVFRQLVTCAILIIGQSREDGPSKWQAQVDHNNEQIKVHSPTGGQAQVDHNNERIKVHSLTGGQAQVDHNKEQIKVHSPTGGQAQVDHNNERIKVHSPTGGQAQVDHNKEQIKVHSPTGGQAQVDHNKEQIKVHSPTGGQVDHNKEQIKVHSPTGGQAYHWMRTECSESSWSGLQWLKWRWRYSGNVMFKCHVSRYTWYNCNCILWDNVQQYLH